MTAGRERSAGQASLSVAAGDRVALRAGGRADGSEGRSSATHPDVDVMWTPREDGAARLARAIDIILGDTMPSDRTHEAA